MSVDTTPAPTIRAPLAPPGENDDHTYDSKESS